MIHMRNDWEVPNELWRVLAQIYGAFLPGGGAVLAWLWTEQFTPHRKAFMGYSVGQWVEIEIETA